MENIGREKKINEKEGRERRAVAGQTKDGDEGIETG